MNRFTLHYRLINALLLCWLFMGLPPETLGAIRLPRIIRDSMILQRDQPLPLWGWASPGEKITLQHRGKTYRSTADASGKWSIRLAPTPAGGPFTLIFKGQNTITLKEVLFGDVWFCSGQSNMVHQLNIHDVTYAADIRSANHPEIRQFLVPTAANLQAPQEDLKQGHWMPAVGEQVRPFSAVAYFFAKQLYDAYHIPIGIINASVGGTPVEAWMSSTAADHFPALAKIIQRNKDSNFLKQQLAVKIPRQQVFPEKDRGTAGLDKWFDTAYQPRGWSTITVPGFWEDLGHGQLNGVVWFRKTFQLPDSLHGRPGRLFMGRIVDADEVYLNGVKIGATTYQYPQRRYPVPTGLLKHGENLLVVRVSNTNGKGGFVPDKPYALQVGDYDLDLRGDWRFKVGQVFLPPAKAAVQSIFNPQVQPAALYNAMVAPIIPYAIKGFCWYQGESNANNPGPYSSYLLALIRDWRKQFQQDSLPFLSVQLPRFMDYSYTPAESQWALIREAQLKSLTEPHTGMAVALDLGEWNDIHPDNKKDVGFRLARIARAIAYGESIPYSGPVFKAVQQDGNKLILSFEHAEEGLTTNDGEAPGSFTIAGADGHFFPAYVQVEGNRLVVWSQFVERPVHVRYAWADNPAGANLCNKEGLPASPFRTDHQ